MKFPHVEALRVPMVMSAVLAALLALPGCGKRGHGEGNAPAAAAQSADDASAAEDQAEQAKYNGYVQSYNRLADRFGLAYTAEPYLKRTLDKPGRDSLISFYFNLDDALKSLSDARAIQSPAYPQLDQLADPLIKDLQTLSDLYKQHRTYYETKAYRDDGFALAKQLDPQIRGAFTDALSQFRKMDSALGEAEQARNERDLARLKALPNQLPYATKHVIVLSKQLVDAALAGADGGNQADFAKADAIKPELYQAVQAMDKEIEQHKTPQDGLSGFGMVLFNARGLLSTYSDLRDARGAEKEHKMQLLLRSYNEIVNQANQI